MWLHVALCSDFVVVVVADTAQVGDTDVEQQQEDLDSKENYPGK